MEVSRPESRGPTGHADKGEGDRPDGQPPNLEPTSNEPRATIDEVPRGLSGACHRGLELSTITGHSPTLGNIVMVQELRNRLTVSWSVVQVK